jgi:glycosyltransferase involved in cell wall biosynthesis
MAFMNQNTNGHVRIRVLFQGIDSLHHYYVILPKYIEALNKEIKVDVLAPDLLEIPKQLHFALKRFSKLPRLASLIQSASLSQKIESLAETMARVQASKYHIAHLNEPFINSTKMIMFNAPKTPKILTFHDPNIINYHRGKVTELKHIAQKTAANVVPSVWLKNLFYEKVGLIPLVIHHCIDLAIFNPFMKKSVAKNFLGMSMIPKIIVWNGRLDPDKDPATMINVIELLVKEYKEVGFILKYRINYYEPNYTVKILKNLKKLRRSLKNRLKIFHSMPFHKLPILYRAADLYFTTSPLESFSLATAEAMACGLPVIIPDSSALPEVVGDAGLYCKVGDPSGFAENILRVLSEEKLARYLSYKSLSRVIHNFHPTKISKQYVNVYKAVLDCDGY